MSDERPTIPFHIWKHEVTLRAIRAGYSAEEIDAVVADRGLKLSLWWNCGEPIEMAADTIIAFCKGAREAAKSWEDSNARVLRRATIEQRARACGEVRMSANGDFSVCPATMKDPS